MKKRIVGILLVSLLVLTIFLGTGCVPSNKESEVKLLGITGSTKYNKQRIAKISAPQSVFASAGMPKFAPLALNDEVPAEPGETGGSGDTTTGEETTDPPAGETPIEVNPEFVSGYTLIYKSQTQFYLTINLENPNNYYIMDFRLTCPGSDISVRQGNNYTNINDPDTYIRWDEAIDRIGNKMATFELRLNSPEVSPDRIKIEDVYYSSRLDGTNKTLVNTDGKETYTIYKIDGPMEMYDRKNNLTEFTFKLNTNGVSIISVTLDETENLTADESGTYHVLHDGKLDIAYEYVVGDDQLPARITSTEEIELLKITNTFDPEHNEWASRYGNNFMVTENLILMFIKITGTDWENISTNDEYFERFEIDISMEGMNTVRIFRTALVSSEDIPAIRELLKSTTLTIAGTDFNLYSDIYMKLPYHTQYAE